MATDVTAEDDQTRNIRSCLERAEAWRQNACYVRQHAALPHLNPQAKAALLREAEASDRQAEWWVNGTEEHRRQ